MKFTFVSAWLAAGRVLLSGAVFAHGNATGIVGERMMGMMMLSEQVKLLTPMFQPGAAFDAAEVEKAAGMIEMHAGRSMTDLFPVGSTQAPSEARDEIWERWPDFAAWLTSCCSWGPS